MLALNQEQQQLKLTQFGQIRAINAQNRLIVVEVLLRAFNGVLGEMSKSAITTYIRATTQILQRGYGATTSSNLKGKISFNDFLNFIT